MICKDVLIVMRGGYNRVQNPEFVSKNINKYITSSLKEENISFDIVFSTYNDNPSKLEVYKDYLNPIQIFFTSNGQIINFKESLKNVQNIAEKYKHIVFLRFEAIYKIPIAKWSFYDKDGLILPFKEDTKELFDKTGWYNDSIIIISRSCFLTILNSIWNADINMYQPRSTLHNLANIVIRYDKTVNIHCLVDGYFQSNSRSFPQVDNHLSPIYILVHHPYKGSDGYLYGL